MLSVVAAALAFELVALPNPCQEGQAVEVEVSDPPEGEWEYTWTDDVGRGGAMDGPSFTWVCPEVDGDFVATLYIVARDAEANQDWGYVRMHVLDVPVVEAPEEEAPEEEAPEEEAPEEEAPEGDACFWTDPWAMSGRSLAPLALVIVRRRRRGRGGDAAGALSGRYAPRGSRGPATVSTSTP